MNAFNKTATEKEEVNYNLPEGLTGAKVVAIGYLGEVEKDYGDGPKKKELYELIFATHKQNEFNEHYTIGFEFEAFLSKAGSDKLTSFSKMIKGTKWAFSAETPLSELLNKKAGLQIIEKTSAKGKKYAKIDSFLDFDDTKGYEETGKIILPPWYADKERYQDVICNDSVLVKVKDGEPIKLSEAHAPY